MLNRSLAATPKGVVGKQEKAIYADWTIIVSTPEGNPSRSFHVHQPVLAAKSGYFRALFDVSPMSGYIERNTKESRFEFPSTVVEHFETVLEFAYCEPSSMTHLSPTQISVLLYASDYLQMEGLHQKCKYWFVDWGGGMGDKDTLEYYSCNRELKMSWIEDFLIDWICTPSVCGDEPEKTLMEAVDVDFLIKILRHEKRLQVKDGRWEEWLLRYCHRRFSEIGLSEFLELTSADLWPSFQSSRTALGFLRCLESLGSNAQDKADMTSDLESRCTSCLKKHFMSVTLAAFDDSKLDENVSVSYLRSFLSSIQKELAEAPPGTAEYDDQTAIMASIRESLESLKIQNSKLVQQLTVRNGTGLVDGTYTRTHKDSFGKPGIDGKGFTIRRYYAESGSDIKWVLVVHASGSWYPEKLYENREESSLEGCPPFKGWVERVPEQNKSLSIQF